MYTTYIGFDPREVDGYAVTRYSIRRYNKTIPIKPLVLSELTAAGMYKRRHVKSNGQLFDVISQAPMATEFALTRFLIGHLGGKGYSLFMDCDMLVRADIEELFNIAAKNPDKAVHCVKHNHHPGSLYKMDGQMQTVYERKNWSSVMIFNNDHPSNKKLSLHRISTATGLNLHQFYWLKDHEIGELDPEWNYLASITTGVKEPKIVHFTDGIPSMEGYENDEYADEWFCARRDWLYE